jgi:O-antigen ligase
LKSLKQQKAVALAGVLYIAMAIAHIPDGIFRYAFDKNAPVQLLMLLFIAAIFAIYISLKSERFHFPKFILLSGLGLVLTQVFSLLLSGNLFGALIGDAGRFVGSASAIALLVVSVFHAQFKFEAFLTLIKFYVIAIEIVCIIGIAQHFNLIELPGDQGTSSTLGNLDFFAAYIGTTLPLLLLWAINAKQRTRVALGIVTAINIYALKLAGPLQGYLDVAFVLVGLAILLLKRFIPRRDISLNKRTFIGVAGIVIWSEFIFLMPFLGNFIPVLGNDIQVKIRSNFWLAGMREFFSHPLLGVGPDQYGYYYEQYRTIDDAKNYAKILSNDAHSASVQTLATVGLLGTVAFLVLLGFTIRAFLVLWDSGKINRKSLFAIALFLFVYLTNSFISPFTLTHKYLLWAVCGFIVGNVYKYPSWKSIKIPAVKLTAITTASVALVIAILFAQGQMNFLRSVDSYAKNRVGIPTYKSSPLLPCYMYYEMEAQIVGEPGSAINENLANLKLASNPRCIAALVSNTRNMVNAGEVESLKPLIYRLFELAPARSDAISFGMYYANRTGDFKLKRAIEKQMKVLGLIYIPGNLG